MNGSLAVGQICACAAISNIYIMLHTGCVLCVCVCVCVCVVCVGVGVGGCV